MDSETLIGGSDCEPGRRDFTALQELVRDVIVSQFLWMFEVELQNGSRMDIYRHRDTCGYLYVAEDGRTFDWAARGQFRETDPLDSLMDACLWWYRWRFDEGFTPPR
jgi:hypothetical protein